MLYAMPLWSQLSLGEAEAPWWAQLLNGIVLLISLFLILLVLIQRGKGGGLAGAFGGMGGSSAFGSRAGDTFTRVTIVVAAVWMVLIGVEVWAIQRANNPVRAEARSEAPPAAPQE